MLWMCIRLCHPHRFIFLRRRRVHSKSGGNSPPSGSFATCEKRGNKSGNNNSSLLSFLRLFLPHRVPRKCLKFRLGLHSTPTRFRHIYFLDSRFSAARVTTGFKITSKQLSRAFPLDVR